MLVFVLLVWDTADGSMLTQLLYCFRSCIPAIPQVCSTPCPHTRGHRHIDAARGSQHFASCCCVSHNVGGMLRCLIQIRAAASDEEKSRVHKDTVMVLKPEISKLVTLMEFCERLVVAIPDALVRMNMCIKAGRAPPDTVMEHILQLLNIAIMIDTMSDLKTSILQTFNVYTKSLKAVQSLLPDGAEQAEKSQDLELFLKSNLIKGSARYEKAFQEAMEECGGDDMQDTIKFRMMFSNPMEVSMRVFRTLWDEVKSPVLYVWGWRCVVQGCDRLLRLMRDAVLTFLGAVLRTATSRVPLLFVLQRGTQLFNEDWCVLPAVECNAAVVCSCRCWWLVFIFFFFFLACRFVTAAERHALVAGLAVTVMLLDDKDADPKKNRITSAFLNPDVKKTGVFKIFKAFPVIPMYPDMPIDLLHLMKASKSFDPAVCWAMSLLCSPPRITLTTHAPGCLSG